MIKSRPKTPKTRPVIPDPDKIKPQLVEEAEKKILSQADEISEETKNDDSE